MNKVTMINIAEKISDQQLYYFSDRVNIIEIGQYFLSFDSGALTLGDYGLELKQSPSGSPMIETQFEVISDVLRKMIEDGKTAAIIKYHVDPMLIDGI